ncbi:MAG TPA: hypothetical protein VKE94_14715 [Gemmataceae bacterium]|nr:hypothetical protein [Gemmataceae bacterium]
MLSVPIAASTSGVNTLVAAQTGRRVRVLGFILSGAGAVNVTFQDGSSANLSGTLAITAAGVNIVAPIAPPVVGSQQFWMITAVSQSLVLNLSAAVGVGGVLCYDFA